MTKAGYIAFFLLVLSACRKDERITASTAPTPYFPELPVGFPLPAVPDDNPLTLEGVRLGKALFFSKALSRDGSVSCASCHHVDRAFSDTVALSLGVQGAVGFRNSPTLANMAYHPAYFKDGGVPSLELQVLAPVHDPLEMDHDILAVAADLKDQEPFRSLSMKAYDRELDPYVITRAIASYERTLISGWSRYDRFLAGDQSALSTEEINGWQIFTGNAAKCASCHSGPDLSDHSFQNIGLYLVYADEGRQRISLQAGDAGKFKVPTLRNIALTSPYMHDGSMASLEDVVDHFASGGEAHPNKSALVTGFALSPQEKADLIAFLNALTDERSMDQIP